MIQGRCILPSRLIARWSAYSARPIRSGLAHTGAPMQFCTPIWSAHPAIFASSNIAIITTLACTAYQRRRLSNERSAFYQQARTGSPTCKPCNSVVIIRIRFFRLAVAFAQDCAPERAHAEHVKPAVVEVEQVRVNGRG